MSILKTNFPLAEILAFYKALANLELAPNQHIENLQAEILADVVKVHKNYPELKDYSPTELMHVYAYEDLVKGKIKYNYLLDTQLLEHKKDIQFYLILNPLSQETDKPLIGLIFGYHDKPVESDQLQEAMKHQFFTIEGKLVPIEEHHVFLPILTHKDLYEALVTHHPSLRLENLLERKPEPLGVLKDLGKGIIKETYYHCPNGFYVNHKGILDHRALYEGTYYISANGKRGIYAPADPEDPPKYLGEFDNEFRFYPGDQYCVDRKKAKYYEVASVRIKGTNGVYTQILKSNLGTVLTNSALLAKNIKLKDRGLLYKFLYDNPEFPSRDAHIRFSLQYGNYLVLETETGFTHSEALAKLVSGECSHIQPDQDMLSWMCVRYGNQRGLHDEIINQIHSTVKTLELKTPLQFEIAGL